VENKEVGDEIKNINKKLKEMKSGVSMIDDLMEDERYGEKLIDDERKI
jgi:hypothetical protein